MQKSPAQKQYQTNKDFLKKLKAKSPKDLDDQFRGLHDEAFQKIDCLDCGNCCKTTSPIFIDTDVDRIAKHLKMSPSAFTQKYLRVDEDNFQVLKTAPCAFLGEDNYCHIYEVRPRACREYPHTNRKRMSQILDLTLENTMICPAVEQIVEKLKAIYPIDKNLKGRIH
ncbi:MAG: YkgJ family cysteine cluster protein [Bacteroidota bacterium]